MDLKDQRVKKIIVLVNIRMDIQKQKGRMLELRNRDVIQYILKTRQEKPNCSERIQFSLQRPKGLVSDGHVQPTTIGKSNELLYSELTHDSSRQTLRTIEPDTKTKIHVLPRRNVIQEAKLQKGVMQSVSRSELTDSSLSNKRYQMSNFYPHLVSEKSQSIDTDNFGTERGGVATRLDKYKYKK